MDDNSLNEKQNENKKKCFDFVTPPAIRSASLPHPSPERRFSPAFYYTQYTRPLSSGSCFGIGDSGFVFSSCNRIRNVIT